MDEQLYFVYVETRSRTYNIHSVSQKELESLITRIATGGKSMVNGRVYQLRHLKEIQIYQQTKDFNVNNFYDHFRRTQKVDLFGCVDTQVLDGIFNKVTLNYIDEDFISKFHGVKPESTQGKSKFVSDSRIEELKKVKTEQFDLRKLILQLEELNKVYEANLVLSTGILLRAIIDHVPPLFNMSNFQSLASQYKSHGSSKSFSNQMKILQDFRDAADSVLHSQIRKRESLPDMIQFEKQTALDILLQEIVRITDTPSPQEIYQRDT